MPAHFASAVPFRPGAEFATAFGADRRLRHLQADDKNRS
jgi:hypothetical protein